MFADPSQVIVTTEECTRPSVHTSYVHHRDFPEVRGEGESLKEAADRLVERLSLGFDHAPSQWRQESLRQAIEDVRAFAEQGSRATTADRIPVPR